MSVVIPCLNEAENIEECVRRSLAALAAAGIAGEVVVADNASEDGSAELATTAGARVVHEPRRGYGSAYLAGFGAARGRYVVMLDADMTYPFDQIPRFVEELRDGAQLVMGDRMDNIEPGAMHWMHRYIGNPLLSGTLNLFFRTGIRDAHCGMRGFRRDILLARASGAIIIGFHVRPDNNARNAAEREGVEIKLYKVIYEAVEDVK
ncbi:MAG: glycosyltransferase, partial [Solirubrobacteraceae bacterium]